MTTERDDDRPELLCVGCGKTPSELDEYVSAAKEECSGVADMTPDDYVWKEEGTLNMENGHFLCTSCSCALECRHLREDGKHHDYR